MALLTITNREEFDQQVWQTDSNFSQERYKEWLTHAAIILSHTIEQVEGSNADVSPDALFILGDVANLLANLQVKVDEDYSATAWEICEEDLWEYDLDGLSKAEIRSIIDEVADRMGDNECVCEDFRIIRSHVAEEHGLQQITWITLREKMLESDALLDIYNKHDHSEYPTFEKAVDEVIDLWRGSYHSTPDIYWRDELTWKEELAAIFND